MSTPSDSPRENVLAFLESHHWKSRCPLEACGDAPYCAGCMTHQTRRAEEAHRGE